MSAFLGMPASRRPLVILLHPKVDHEKDYAYFWMPFSLLTLAKPLLDAGLVDVMLFDGNQASDVAWSAFLDEHLDRAVCIGVSIMTGGGQIGHALDLVRVAKERPGCPPVVFGGPHVSSQGCVYKCQFCYELTYQRKYSAMAADGLVADIDDLARRFGLNGIKFYDADWFVNLKRAAAFCEGVIAGERDIKWAASINPNDILKARRAGIPLLTLVAESGGSRLLMGVESGNDRVLRDVVKKEVTRAHILDVAREIADHGILGSYTFIVGFPGESDAEVDDTYSLIEELRSLEPTPETRVHLFAPYPGTPLYEDAVRAGFEPPSTLDAWSHFDYYDSQTPWTSAETVRRARAATQMRLKPQEVGT